MPDCLTANDITVDVGGPAKHDRREDRFLIEPVVQVKAMQGWKQDQQTGQFVSQVDPAQESVERTVAFVLEQAPK